jgi:hypothetical protein
VTFSKDLLAVFCVVILPIFLVTRPQQILSFVVLVSILGPKRDEVTGDWRKLHNEELHNLYSPNVIRMIKSRRIRGAGHVARIGRRGMYRGYSWESPKERDH